MAHLPLAQARPGMTPVADAPDRRTRLPTANGRERRTDAGSDEGPVFDLAAALEYVANDRETLRDLLELFIGQWPTLRERLTRAHDRNAVTELADLAHRIRGGASAIGASGVYARAVDCERRWRSGDLGEARQGIAGLDDAVEALAKAVAEMLGRYSRP